ncbi:54S ribosomal protein L24, mitochondrial [Hypsizygus marmoreus]|uniref:Large ribosomal subunit protein bL28m n=1 Tax=Hypsizygus marmoreus TaxID=39966 RepID=A0A369J9V7_HYPMA|nr:54S ribosomal protein L24, mitochondrial [Hypsizygus marmoreus]
MFPSIPLFSAIVSQPFKRSQLGLFQGKTKQYGNNVPFSKHKTRRTWLPNVQRKRLASDILGEVRVKLTTRALRTIKKHGGLDNYVEKTRADILGWEGMRLRLKIREHAENFPKPVVAEAVEPPPAEVEAKVEEPVANNEDSGSAEVAPVDPKKVAKQARKRARRQLQVIGSNPPDTSAGERQRYALMKKLNLESLPTARQTILFLHNRRQDLINASRIPTQLPIFS